MSRSQLDFREEEATQPICTNCYSVNMAKYFLSCRKTTLFNQPPDNKHHPKLAGNHPSLNE
jgi:hypothetical protein